MSGVINGKKIVLGSLVIITFATIALVVLPYMQLHKLEAPEGLKPYTDQQALGREVYIANGCIYCHSQQPRDANLGPDGKRGWGRASVAADYVYDQVHLLGTMRTGPDLFNIGARQPSADWQLGHLYQPRAYTPGSIMPSFPFLFTERKGPAVAGEVVVTLPPAFTKPGITIIANQDALNLVEYLKGMDHTYKIKKTVKESFEEVSGASGHREAK
ncbi:MAG: cbb3-type cytochrome c oxidase subunit II [Methylophilaceae bacterium]